MPAVDLSAFHRQDPGAAVVRAFEHPLPERATACFPASLSREGTGKGL
jgi:hypothetical protein